MAIKIDREMFKERVHHRFIRRMHGDIATGDLADVIYDLAQEWLDKEEWTTNPELDTSKECRIEMKRYITSKLDFDADKSWCIADNSWKWIAQNVVLYIVRLIIDHHFADEPPSIAAKRLSDEQGT